ncbi:MAG: glycosyltransferase [Candidatus Eisenbacteria bacterium]|nr:glycosyltransferase [Candidatus Eisenbacteria bacterium]
MRILMITHFLPFPPQGGSLQRSYNILKQMAKRHQVHLVSLSQKALHPDKNSLARSIEALKEHCPHVKAVNIPSDSSRLQWYLLLLLNLLSPTPYSVWRFRSKQMASEIKRFLNGYAYDVLYFDTIDLAQYLPAGLDTPTVMNHHNVESGLALRRSASERNPLLRLYLRIQGLKIRRYETVHAPRFDLNLAVSEVDKALFESFIPGARFTVIPSGTDTDYFRACDPGDSKELVFVGGMTWYPNAAGMSYYCRKIFPLIKAEVPNVVMNIIGRSPPRAVQECSLQDSAIRLHGFLPDIREVVGRSSVYVVPLTVGGGTRLKILDAFSCGKAVVSTSLGCEGIEVTPGENILIGDTPESFADQVVRLLRDKKMRERISTNARRLVEDKYGWPIIGERLDMELETLRNAGSGR